MSQKGTPYDGIRPLNIDAGGYSSIEVLPERMTTDLGGVCGSDVLGVNLDSITLIEKQFEITLSNIQFRVAGTTLYSNGVETIVIDWSHLPSYTEVISLQIGVLVNRNILDETVDGVLPRTARLVGHAYSNEYGMFAQVTEDRDITDVFIMPVFTISYKLATGYTFLYKSRHGVDWTKFFPFRDMFIPPANENTFNVVNWNTIILKGVMYQRLPRLEISIQPIIDVQMYNDGDITESAVYTHTDGAIVLWLMLSNEVLGTGHEDWNICTFTVNINRNGNISGSVELIRYYSSVIPDITTRLETLSGFVTFGAGTLSVTNFKESLYNMCGAEITMEVI